MLEPEMKPSGTYKIAHRRRGSRVEFPRPLAPREVDLDSLLEPIVGGGRKLQRILDSLRREIVTGGDGRNVRIRQIFREPREIYRLELELPELGYQRTTLLDGEALDELLEADDVRQIIHASIVATDENETTAAQVSLEEDGRASRPGRCTNEVQTSVRERCPGQDSNLHGR